MIRPRTNQMDPIGEMKTDNRRILVYKKENGILFFVVADKSIRLFGEDDINGSHVGDIYLGRVENIAANIGGVFLRIADKETVFLPEHEMTEAFPACCLDKGNIKQGDEMTIRIKKPKYKNKCAMATTKLGLSPEFTEQIKKKALHSIPGERLYAAPGQLLSYLRQEPLTDADYILTENPAAYEWLRNQLDGMKWELARCRLYEDPAISMSALYGMQKKMEDLTATKIWLKSGASIYIEPTEAMTVIDVNSGKIMKKQMREETVLSVNLEALSEIVRQVSYRNISGIILIDFINMDSVENRNILMDACKESFRFPNPPISFGSYTKLGLVEATRAKRGIDIYEFLRKNNITILL